MDRQALASRTRLPVEITYTRTDGETNVRYIVQLCLGNLFSFSSELLLPLLLLLLLHPFHGLFSRTTWVSRYQIGKTSLDLNEARDDGVLWWQWHQLDYMQTICTLLHTDNHTNTSSLNLHAGCSS